MRAMNILHTEASCGWGGQEIRILTEARGMRDRGHLVELVCPPQARIYAAASAYGVPAHPLPIGKKRLGPLLAMRRFLAAHQFDVINTHSSTDAWLAALACKTLSKPPSMIRTRHLSTAVNQSAATRWLYLKASAHVVVTGRALKSQLTHDNGFPAAHITSIPTGIDLDRFRPQAREAARAALGLPLETVFVGILATLRDWKGHTELFEALKLLLPVHPELRVLIIGDGPYRDRLDRRAADLGVADKLDFVGHRDNPEQWLPAIDVFVLPSWGDEGVSQALMQAMACALPIVTTPVGSLTEVVHHGQTGLIVPPRDAGALAAAINQLLTNPGEAQRLAAAARQLALAQCGLERMLDGMEAVFQRFTRPGAR